MKHLITAAVATAVGLLAACGSPDSTAPGSAATLKGSGQELSDLLDSLCQEMAEGGAQVKFTPEPACANCTASEVQQSADGTDVTHTTLTFGPGMTLSTVEPGVVSLLATAQAGVVFPAGHDAAVTLSATRSQRWRVTVRTYLDGVLQNEVSETMNVDDDSRTVVGTHTDQPFNAVEARFDQSHVDSSGVEININGSNNESDIQVHEFCSDFEFPPDAAP